MNEIHLAIFEKPPVMWCVETAHTNNFDIGTKDWRLEDYCVNMGDLCEYGFHHEKKRC